MTIAALLPWQGFVKLSDKFHGITMTHPTVGTTFNNLATSYQLLLKLGEDIEIQVGALGRFCFMKGFYIYSGSARRNMEARLARHLRRQKKQRWHIDYLTSHADCQVIATRRSHTPECTLNQATPGSIIAPRFGASDCTSGCGSHLKYLGNRYRHAWGQNI